MRVKISKKKACNLLNKYVIIRHKKMKQKVMCENNYLRNKIKDSIQKN